MAGSSKRRRVDHPSLLPADEAEAVGTNVAASAKGRVRCIVPSPAARPPLPAAVQALLAPARSVLSRLRLSGRIVLVSMLLLLLVQVAGFSVIRQSIELNAQRQLRDRLTLAGRVWDRLLDQRATKLGQSAAALATDFGFREALEGHDMVMLGAVLGNHGKRLGASMSALLDPQFELRALSEGVDANQGPALRKVAPELAQHPGSGHVALVAGLPYQFVMVPVKTPALVGWVLMGFPLDAAMVNDMAEVAGVQATLVVMPARGEPRVLATSFQPDTWARPLAHKPADGEMSLGTDPHLVSSARVASGPEGRVSLRLAGSLSAAESPYRPLHWLLAAITVLGLILFGLGSHWMALRITEPLRRLSRASERLGRGDYDQPLQFTGRGDEIDDLAGAFDHMRVNIAAQQHQIRQLAYRDRLTGLPNRLQFRDDVEAAIEENTRKRQPLAVVVVDLDRFKQINDVLGFAFGDRVLLAMAQRLQQVVRQHDVVARLGGNAFALLLRHADTAFAAQLAQRIAAALEQPIRLDDQTIDLSAGVGIACWPQHAADVDSLISRAELAMNSAKRRTAGAQVYDASVDTASAQNLSLLSELRRAIERNELRLFLQPKVQLASGEANAAEALVRWQHPTRGLVPPMEFIPFAEQTGFIRQLTLWMMGEVARLQPTLAGLGVKRVSVNLSTRDLMDPELPTKLDAILQAHGAWPDAFCLEITESAIMDDPQRAEATLNRLANRGFKLSIDDFGTGYSSLAYLKRLPVAELKIDKSFVLGMERSSGDAKIVRSTIDLAHNLGLKVVAEGVENEAIMALLRQLQCDEAQGFHLSRPLPVDQFVQWVGRWRASQAASSAHGQTASAPRLAQASKSAPAGAEH